jgi:hypothetical protein
MKKWNSRLLMSNLNLAGVEPGTNHRPKAKNTVPRALGRLILLKALNDSLSAPVLAQLIELEMLLDD